MQQVSKGVQIEDLVVVGLRANLRHTQELHMLTGAAIARPTAWRWRESSSVARGHLPSVSTRWSAPSAHGTRRLQVRIGARPRAPRDASGIVTTKRAPLL